MQHQSKCVAHGKVVCLVAVAIAVSLPGCTRLFKKGERVTVGGPGQRAGRAGYMPTAAPTVPPPTSTAWPTPSPRKTPRRAIRPGEPIGPEITFLGITRADGKHVDPVGVDKKGIPIYKNFVGSGFQLVIEGRPGLSGYDIGRRVFAHDPKKPDERPDLEIEVNRPLGDGSKAVCDRWRPRIGGIPAINPPSFRRTQAIADTLNDLSCRFEVFIESMSACTLNQNEDWEFKSPDTTVQFCMMVARAWNFPLGKTLVSARLRDSADNPGPIKRIWIKRPKVAPKPRPKPTPPPKPKGLPTR